MKNIEQYLQDYLKLGFSPIPTMGKVTRLHWKEFKFDVGILRDQEY